MFPSGLSSPLASLRCLAPWLLTLPLCAQTVLPPPGSTAPAPAPAAPEPPAAIRGVTSAELIKHATFLASDELEGRLTGSPGQQAAARYIADHFRELGLEPLGDEVEGKRGFLQHYGVVRTTLAPGHKVSLAGVEIGDAFALLGAKVGAVAVTGPLRWCGRGRTRGDQKEIGEEETLAGQIALLAVRPLKGEIDGPLSIEHKFGMSQSLLDQMRTAGKAMVEKGAAAVVFMMLDDRHGLSDVLNYTALSPGKDLLALRSEDGQVGGLLGMVRATGAPTLVLPVPSSMRLLAALKLSVDEIRTYLHDGGVMPPIANGMEPKGALAYTVDKDDAALASNVVAVLRGSDPELCKEAIVYSAHMDHVGRRLDGEVFNGADDNASGSAGLMAIATAYAQAKERCKRSIVFLSVSGEELGLWGSAHFADHPTWPADQIIANINTDMIGRSGPESAAMEVTVTPSNRHKMFSTIVQDAAGFGEALGMTFTSGDKYYTRSDHYNFARKGIPVVFFCNGEHEDYHQVSDHADKLDGAKMERIGRLAFWTGWSVANAADRPRRLGKQPSWR